MRVLMLSWEFPPKKVGGLGQHVYELSRALVDSGWEVDVLTSGEKNMPVEETMEQIQVFRVIPWFEAPGRGFLDWVYRFNFALQEKGAALCAYDRKYSLIHAHDWLVAFAARGLKHGFTIPLLSTIHATEFGRHQGLHNEEQKYISSIEWHLTYESWKIICCSQYMREELRSFFHLPVEKIVTIPNGIRVEPSPSGEINIAGKSSFHFPGDYLFYIGRLVPEKGVQILLEGAQKIIGRFPQVKLLIAGTGPYEEYLRNLSKELGLNKNVSFLGFIDDQTRNALYRGAAAAVFPSLYEPFGIVALEAMASGAPVIVSSSGGLDEIVEHEVDGLKVYPGDSNSLAQQVCRLLESKKLAGELKANASRKVLEYSWEEIAHRTAAIYREIILSQENKRWQQKVAQKAVREQVSLF